MSDDVGDTSARSRWEEIKARKAVRERPTSVAHLSAREWPRDRSTFNDALKLLGIDDSGQREWVVNHIDPPLRRRLEHVGYDMVFWFPPSREYLAVGQFVDETAYAVPSRWVRDACVYRTRVELPAHEDVDRGWLLPEGKLYRWCSTPIPGTPGRGRPSVGAGRPAAVCSRCFMQLPASGVCDECD
ncbi:hypothetical protein [Cellulosimicrobium cellulans]|uniref:hypothetical protein n=1 Tax=Cellulosimicrobium cellulans TaxID=1710 RepID=UPI003814BC7D